MPQPNTSWQATLLLVFLTVTLLRSNNAVSPGINDVTDVFVTTDSGQLRGTRRTANIGLHSVETNTVDEFLGLPYAAPPVGERRFQRPSPVKPWSDVRDSTHHRAACPQSGSSYPETRTDLQDEDCLYLNVYAPYKMSDRRASYPVMVFIHGGSYFYGTGNRYNGTALAQTGVVFVAINYRLGLLGFLTTGDKTLPGNYGLYDQIEALKWVQENIGFFRGDRTRVTIFGSSAGGASVGLLYLSPLTTGLFHRAIAQSGTANAMWATHSKNRSEFRSHVAIFGRENGCSEESSIADHVKCLKSADWTRLTANVICTIITCVEVDPNFKPVIDGDILPYSPDEFLRRRRFPRMAYMTGTVRSEFGESYGDDLEAKLRNDTAVHGDPLTAEIDDFLATRYHDDPAVRKFITYHYTNWSRRYPLNDSDYTARHYNRAEMLTDLGLVAPTAKMAADVASVPGCRVYVYYVDGVTSFHSVELNYVLGAPFLRRSFDEFQPTTNFSSTDRQLSEMFIQLWTNFARCGNPTPDSENAGFTWVQFQASDMSYVHIRARGEKVTAQMLNDYYARKSYMWNTLVPEVTRLFREERETPRTLCPDHQKWIFLTISIILLCLLFISLCYRFRRSPTKAYL
ncbi:hypothetical protein NP493_357g02001 [Ridgeia piscesae]|uniref:Carboxylic ester hydrolase n=1 Tax=Ridgeia piscesae TaxID=27915 RepID=A0AAD9L3V6_RIDPI|nr:hypothetical protein NP493_357g02001 [Ridgeia piscesae]